MFPIVLSCEILLENSYIDLIFLSHFSKLGIGYQLAFLHGRELTFSVLRKIIYLGTREILYVKTSGKSRQRCKIILLLSKDLQPNVVLFIISMTIPFGQSNLVARFCSQITEMSMVALFPAKNEYSFSNC